MPSLVAGDVVGGKYVLDRLLGRGGMGAVFAARQTNLNNRQVAIKVMLADPGNEEARQRFLNEGSAAATLRSEHVVQVYDLGSERGFEYMVLELLEGEDLSQQLERTGPMPPAQAVSYVLQALRGLGEAHRHGIVHRDLKPSNLFLARRPDGSSVLKILDFGISKAQSLQNPLGQTPGALTSTKAMLGSPLYMSPEQLRSSKNVDARADLWAMGIILYELMTGRLPYMGESLGELFACILENEPVPPRTYAPAIPPALEQIVLRCLQKRVENRFSSAAELYDALNQVAAQAQAAPAPSAMAATALPPNGSGSSPGFGSSPALPAAPPAGSSPGMPGMAVTPGYGRPPGHQTTGSGANIPVVKGTVPLGASTPGVGESAPAWSPPPAAQKGAGVLVAIGGAVAAIVVIGGVTVYGMRGKSLANGAGSASSASASAAVVVTATPPPSATPSASVAAITTASPETATAPTATPVPQVATATGATTKPKAGPATPKTPTPTTKPVEAAATAQPTSAPVVPVTATPPPATPRPKDGPGAGVNTR